MVLCLGVALNFHLEGQKLWYGALLICVFILVLKFIHHLLQLIQYSLLWTGYFHGNFKFQKNENVSENLRQMQRSLE